MSHDECVRRLLSAYATNREQLGQPPWAYPLPASIPFVGKRYLDTRPRVAIYASAENLSHYERRPETLPPFLKDERRHDRHRAALDSSPPLFFPMVHIAPVEKGGLLCAARFIKESLLGESTPDDPWDFIEELAVANVAKYSILVDGGANQDYADDSERLSRSLPYFEVDLAHMHPDILVIPKTIYKHRKVRQAVTSAVPEARVLLIPQFNPTVVNVHLKQWDTRAQELARELAGSMLARWTDQIEGFKKGYPYRFYVEIDNAWRTRRT